MKKEMFVENDLVYINQKDHPLSKGKGFGVIREIKYSSGTARVLTVHTDDENSQHGSYSVNISDLEHQKENLAEIHEIPVYYELKGYVNVRANTLEEAVEKAETKHSLPEHGDYVEGSFEVDRYALGLEEE